MDSPSTNLGSIYRLPVIGTLWYYFVYSGLRASLGLVMRLQRFRRVESGRCTFWAPEERLQTVFKALDFLQLHDKQMFQCLVEQRRFLYYSDGPWQRVIRLYPIHKRFFEWGPEALAAFFVQCILWSEANPGGNPYRLAERGAANVRAVPKRVIEWMNRQPIPAAFVETYQAGQEGA